MRRLLKRSPAVLVAAFALAIPVVSSRQRRPDAHRRPGPGHPGQRPTTRSSTTTFLYRDLYFSATDFIYRVAGADGPPSNPSDVNNLPKNYNGAQRVLLVVEERDRRTPTTTHMGPMGRFVTAKDHFDPCCSGSGNQTYPFQLDDATVTIPGLIMPGPGGADRPGTTTARRPDQRRQRRGDRQPHADERHAQRQLGQRLAVRRRLRRSPWGWPRSRACCAGTSCNGTYPKRTIKIGLFDAEETRPGRLRRVLADGHADDARRRAAARRWRRTSRSAPVGTASGWPRVETIARSTTAGHARDPGHRCTDRRSATGRRRHRVSRCRRRADVNARIPPCIRHGERATGRSA